MRRGVLTAIIAIALTAVLFLALRHTTDDGPPNFNPGSSFAAGEGSSKSVGSTTSAGHDVAEPEPSEPSGDGSSSVAEFVDEFRALPLDLTGPDLDMRRLQLLNRAAKQLSASDLLDLADELKGDFHEDNIYLLAATCFYSHDQRKPLTAPANSAFLDWLFRQRSPAFRSELILQLGIRANGVDGSLGSLLESLDEPSVREEVAAGAIRASLKGPFPQIHPEMAHLLQQHDGGFHLAAAISDLDFPEDYDFRSLLAGQNVAGLPEPLLGAVMEKWAATGGEAVFDDILALDPETLDPALRGLMARHPETAEAIHRRWADQNPGAAEDESPTR